MLRRRFAALLMAALPVACTAQTATPSPAAAPATTSGAPATETAPAATAPAAQKKITFSSCNVNGPYIAMTYDDGPHGVNTPRLLDMLKERNIKATFYMVGQCVVEYPQIVKRMVAEGHEVASHSWSHPLLSKMTDATVHSQLKKTHDAIVEACGVAPKTMRPPYGGFTERQRRWCFGEFGYNVVLWDVDPLDWKVRNAASVERQILSRTRPGSIILTHDIHKSTIDAMPATLDALLAKGYKFVTVSELIAMDRPAAPKPKATPKASPGTPVEPAAPTAPATPSPSAPTTEPAPAADTPVAPTSTTSVAPAPAPAPRVPAATLR